MCVPAVALSLWALRDLTLPGASERRGLAELRDGVVQGMGLLTTLGGAASPLISDPLPRPRECVAALNLDRRSRIYPAACVCRWRRLPARGSAMSGRPCLRLTRVFVLDLYM